MSLSRWVALVATGASLASTLVAIGAVARQVLSETLEGAASGEASEVRERRSLSFAFAQNDATIRQRQLDILNRPPIVQDKNTERSEGDTAIDDRLAQISPSERLLSPRSAEDDTDIQKDLSLYDYYNQEEYEGDDKEETSAISTSSGGVSEKYVGFSAPHPVADADKKYFNPAPALDYANTRLLSDWNRRFRNCLRKFRKLEATSPLAHRYDANLEIMHLAQDFIHAATTYGKIIIAEYFLPVEQRTIKPVRLGGLMGGQKYIVHNILFKFATDDNQLFGSDYAAAKVAGNELRGLISYFNCKIEELHLPLMALVDYRGFRLVAMSILPINKNTIVYGSCDAGRNIHTNRNPTIDNLIAEAAKKMNLKPHHCRVARSRGDYVYKEQETAQGEKFVVRIPRRKLTESDAEDKAPGVGSPLSPAPTTPSAPALLFQVPVDANAATPWLSTPTPSPTLPRSMSSSRESEAYDVAVPAPPPPKRKNIPPEFMSPPPAHSDSMSTPLPRRNSPRPSIVPKLDLSSSSTPTRFSDSDTESSSHSRSNSYSAQALSLARKGANPGFAKSDSQLPPLSSAHGVEDNSLSSGSLYFTELDPPGVRYEYGYSKAAVNLPTNGGYDNAFLPNSHLTEGYDTRGTASSYQASASKAVSAPQQSSSTVEQPLTELLCSPADLEGHLGLDNRFYLLDFSRTQPPELPNRNFKNAHLSRLLRPEFVRSYYKPLCPDAFSGFIKGTPGEQEHNADIEEATRHLYEVTIPKFARELEISMSEAREQGRLNKFRLTEFAHSHGINCRHFGRLRREVRDPDFKRLILLEILARCIKNNLRWKLREKMKQIALPLEEPYRRLVIDYFNLVFGNTKISEDYWNNWLKKDLEVNFVNSLLESESAPTFNLKKGYSNKIDDDFLYHLFERVTHMMGMTWGFGPSRTSNFLGEKPFDDTDLEFIGERVKHMNFIAHAHGYFYHLKGLALRIEDPIGAQKFYETAIEKFEDALNTDPNNKEILLSMALTHMLAIEDIYANVPNARFLPHDQRVMKAEEYCLRAIYAEPKYDSFSLFRYAQFLEKCGRLEAAEDYYLMALEADPNNAGCLHCYGQFLSDRGEHDLAEQFFKRASANTIGLKQWPQWYH